MDDSEHPPAYEFEGFRLDRRRRTLMTTEGRAVPLAPKTLDTLCHLVERAGQVIGKRELLEAVWPHVVVEENNLNQAISQLRRALGERSNEHRFIVTEPGRGYRFVAAVSVAGARDEPTVDPAPALAEAVTPPKAKPAGRYIAGALAVVASLAAGVVGVWWYSQPPSALPNSVAVLPFENLNSDPSNSAFAAGLHGEIVSQLTKISSLNVVSRSSVLGVASEGRPVQDVAAELNVETVLHATVEFADDRVRIRPQLVSGKTGRTLWAESYDHGFEDIFAIESEIAARVANALSAELSVAEQTAVDKPPTKSPAAYAAYLRAAGVSATSQALALEYLDDATDLDPEFALAYAAKAQELAATLVARVGQEAANPAEWDNLERRIRDAAGQALNLDQDLWLAHRALGDLNQRRWRWTEALRNYERAAANTPRGIRRISEFEPFFRDLDFAANIREQREIVALNPGVAEQPWVLGLYHAYQRDAEPAAVAFREAVSLAPDNPVYHVWLAHGEGMLGRHEEALRELRRGEQVLTGAAASISLVNYAYAYAQNGSPTEARRLFDLFAARATDRRHQAGHWALAHLAVGDVQAAREALEVVVAKIQNEEPDPGYLTLRLIRANIYADPVLDEPPFTELRAKLRGH